MKLSASAVRLAYSFAAESDIRFWLNGVHVEPHPAGGAQITGCNGHKILQVHDRAASDVEAMIINLDKPARAALKRGRWVVTEFEPKKVAVVNSDLLPIYLQWTKYQVEGKFPDGKTLLGERESWVAGLHGVFNVNYIADATIAAASALGIGHYDKYAGMSFYSQHAADDTNTPVHAKVLFIVDGKTPAWGMVMGLRGYSPDPLKIAFPDLKAA